MEHIPLPLEITSIVETYHSDVPRADETRKERKRFLMETVIEKITIAVEELQKSTGVFYDSHESTDTLGYSNTT